MQVLFRIYDSKHILNQTNWKESLSLGGKCWWKAAKVNIQKHPVSKRKHFTADFEECIIQIVSITVVVLRYICTWHQVKITFPWYKCVYV